MLLVAVAVLHFTVSAFEADTLVGCAEGQSLEHVKSLRLYRAVCYQQPPVREFIRERPTQPGPDTLQVDASQCATYFVTVVDSSGNESCERGATVGIPPTGVWTPEPTDRFVLFDLSGRRVSGKLKPGIYVRRTIRAGKVVRTEKIVTFR